MIAAVILAALAYLAYRFFLWPPTPEQLRDRVIHALETGNAEALCRLADPEELQLLNVTPDRVNALLRETLWKEGYLTHAKIIPAPTPVVDQKIWGVTWKNEKGIDRVVITAFVDHPQKGWKLLLTFTLRSSCVWMARSLSPRDQPPKSTVRLGDRMYQDLSARLGIRGIRSQDGNYVVDGKVVREQNL